MKKIADEAMKLAPCVEKQIVVKRAGIDVNMTADRDFWYHDLFKEAGQIVVIVGEVADVHFQRIGE